MKAITSVFVNYQLVTCHILEIFNSEKMPLFVEMPDPGQNPQGTSECDVIESYVNLN